VEVETLLKHQDQSEILLINPTQYSFGRLKRIRKTSPPLGILYIATFLKKKGFGVRVIDGMVEPESLDGDFISNSKAIEVVGITCTTPVVPGALSIAERIKRGHPDCVVVLGGAHASVCYEELIENKFIDFVVKGEGEYPFERICQWVLNKRPIDDYSGIMDNANPLNRRQSKYISNLDDIPFPDRSLIPFGKYELSPINYKRKPSTPVITTRGCPFRCTFCANPVHGKKTRFHSPEYVIEEIKYLIKDFSVRDIMFWDDTFTLKTERVETICRLMLREDLRVTWSCAARVDRIDKNLLALMKRAGCWQISFGVETGSERLLKKIEKGISKDQIISALNLCKEVGIETRGFFILGIPSETLAESYDTMAFAKEINPSYVQFSLAVPYPGSEFYENAISEGWQRPEWKEFNTYPEDQPVYVPRGRSAEELIDIQTKAVRDFYFRPAYILDRFKHITSMYDLLTKAKVAFNLLRF